MSCWIHLGLEPTHDLDAIRQAYRRQLPAHHPESDPEGFQALRAAYEQALRLAREGAASSLEEQAPDHDDTQRHPALAAFHRLLEEPTQRFDPHAWQRYIAELDELPLETLEDLGRQLLALLPNCGPLGHRCANLLARRLGWAEQVLRLPNPQEVEALLQRLEEPDPFDTGLMRDWPPTAQLETLWYFRSLEYCYQNRPLFEYEQFASLHTCLAIPDDEALVQRLLVQFSQAGIASRTLHGLLLERQRLAPDDPDLLYLLARQADALGAQEQALDCWLRLWREQAHPEAERWLLDLCTRLQPQRLPLLIQAFDRQARPTTWPDDLADPAQAWGSPAQSPQTLARWSQAARLELDGIAGRFVEWRLDGDDELPLLAWLLEDQQDHALHRLYRHAWALQRGEAGLLRQVLAEPVGEDALDALILEGFQRQAEQQLHWLEHSPVVQALVRACASDDPAPMLPEALDEVDIHPVCREWLRRMRPYSAIALQRLNDHFQMQRMFTAPFAMDVQALLTEQALLPAPPDDDEALWGWHRQNLFMLALVLDPARWLALVSPTLLTQLAFPAGHPCAALHDLLLHLQRQDETDHLLGWLDGHDPLQRIVSARLLDLHQALASDRLPSNLQLHACLEHCTPLLDGHRLHQMLLYAVLYHDPSLDRAQRQRMLERLEGLDAGSELALRFRDSLVKGTPVLSARDARALGLGLEYDLLRSALNSLRSLAGQGLDGIPRHRTLRALQRGKDDPNLDLGLRCALTALLSWSERLLFEFAQTPPTPAWELWKLRSRLDRSNFALQLLLCLLAAPFYTTQPAVLPVIALVLISACLRRLRDMGRGVPSLLVLMGVSRLLPFAVLVLLGLGGDPLPNRYGITASRQDVLQYGLQAALRR